MLFLLSSRHLAIDRQAVRWPPPAVVPGGIDH